LKYQPATVLTSTNAPAIKKPLGIRRQKGRLSAGSTDHGGGVQPGISPSVGVDAASVAGPSGWSRLRSAGCIPCCGHG
jgi:hypothetical protein